MTARHPPRAPSLLRVDLHCHTSFSPDSTTSPSRLVERAREAGLDRVAVTDHGTVEGARVAWAMAPELIIVGEEIRCADRTELIGLFIEEAIPQGLPLRETAERIRDQGGVVYAPHPFAYVTWPGDRARRAMDEADVVEAFNSRAFWPSWNRAAEREGRRVGLPLGAGSDAHFEWEMGQAYTEMPGFQDAAGFRAALRQARPVGVERSPATVHVASAALKVAQCLVAAGEDLQGLPTPGAASFRASPSRGGPAMG